MAARQRSIVAFAIAMAALRLWLGMEKISRSLRLVLGHRSDGSE